MEMNSTFDGVKIHKIVDDQEDLIRKWCVNRTPNVSITILNTDNYKNNFVLNMSDQVGDQIYKKRLTARGFPFKLEPGEIGSVPLPITNLTIGEMRVVGGN